MSKDETSHASKCAGCFKLGHNDVVKKTLKIILSIVGWIMVLAAIGIVFINWQFERPPFPISRLERLHEGMTTNDVMKVLGEPTSTRKHTNAFGQPYLEWSYSRRMSWPVVAVYFKPDGTYGNYIYDR